MEEEKGRMRAEIEAVRSDKHTAVADAVEAQRQVCTHIFHPVHCLSCQIVRRSVSTGSMHWWMCMPLRTKCW